MAGAAMFKAPPQGDLAYFRQARRLLQQLHRRGIAHNDLAKEANWLVQADGSPGIIDFQLAVIGRPRSRGSFGGGGGSRGGVSMGGRR